MRRRERAVAGFFGSVALASQKFAGRLDKNLEFVRTEHPTGKFRKHGDLELESGPPDRKCP